MRAKLSELSLVFEKLSDFFPKTEDTNTEQSSVTMLLCSYITLDQLS